MGDHASYMQMSAPCMEISGSTMPSRQAVCERNLSVPNKMAYGEFTAPLLRSKHRIFSNLEHNLFTNKSVLKVCDHYKN